jgi:diaminopimelate decarboxylase
MFDNKTKEKFKRLQTPFYYYDIPLLIETLQNLKQITDKYGFIIHYAIKANANDKILKMIKEKGFGADCVSGNEILKAIETGFENKSIVFAGVGKSDLEIKTGLEHNIFCFNVESIQELEVINSIAGGMNKVADIALRINPNVNAKTHQYITTGLEENKFGINTWEFDTIINRMSSFENIKLAGLHFHIGSQITDLDVFKNLCTRVNEIQKWFNDHHITFEHLNVGGGLGVNYTEPDKYKIPEFNSFFSIFKKFIHLQPKQELHFELGRTLVAQCGSLIAKVLYVKEGVNTKFIILDAGMTELLRPALYQAYHKIENITSNGRTEKYDVVGPICETSDTFGKAVLLPETKRGDLIAIRSAGAYGKVMSSQYNLRSPVTEVLSDELK